MPNWCDNLLKITTDNPKLITLIKQFIADEQPLKDDKGLFDTLVPLNRDQVSDKEEDSLYFQAINKWGTKWDIGDSFDFLILKDDETFEIDLAFQSAWSPPIRLVDNIAKSFFVNDETKEAYQLDMALYFMELGMDFCGSYFHNGLGDSGCDLSICEMLEKPNDDFLEIIEALNFDLYALKSFFDIEEEDQEQN
jgi:hypothetical protein